MRISWTGVGIFFQAGAVNEVNDDSYSIITNYSNPIQYYSYSSSHLLLFLIALNYNVEKIKFLYILYLNMNIAQIVPIVILEIRFRKKSYV